MTLATNPSSTLTRSICLLLIFCISMTQDPAPVLPKIAWVYLEQPGEMDQLQKMCLDNIKHFSELSHYQFRFLSKENLSEYINIDNQIKLVQRSTLADKATLRRGLAQLTILQTHGGVWFDLPTMLTENLEWLQTLANQKYVNNRIEGPQAVLFYLPEWFEDTYRRKIGKSQDLVVQPHYQAWFVATNKQSQFIKDWKKMYMDLNTMQSSELTAFYKEFGLNSNDFILEPSDFLGWTARAVIKMKQSKFDQQYGTGSSRKLAINYYKISGIDGSDSAYQLTTETRGHTHLTTKYFAEIPINSNMHFFSYLLRIPAKVHRELATLLDANIPMIEHLHTSVELVCEGATIPYRHIVTDSVIDKYLLKVSPRGNDIQLYSSEFIAHNCSVTYEAVLYQFFIGYLLPLAAAVLQIYIVRRMILIFKPEWGVRRMRKM